MRYFYLCHVFSGKLDKGIKYLLLSTFFFSLMNICIKFLVHIPVMELVFFRALFSFIISFSILKYQKISIIGNNKKALLLRGLFGSLSLIAYAYTLYHMPLASAVSIQYLSPIFTILLAIWIVNERASIWQFLFFIISFLGVLAVKGWDERVSLLDLSIGIFSALCSGLAYNMIRKTSDTEHPYVVVFYFPLVTLPISILGMFLFKDNYILPKLNDWPFLIAIGITTQLGQMYMTKAMQGDKASEIVNIQYVGLIYSIFFGYFLFDEKHSILSFIGMGLILSGIFLNYFYKKYFHKFIKK